MPLTVGTDTFVSLADANAYFAARLRSENWDAADAADREKALRLATAILTRQRYVGTLASSSQILAWPRNGAVDQEGRAIGSSTIPQAIKDACCEFALRLLTDDFYADSGNKGIRKVTVANIAIEYSDRAPEREMPDAVLDFIRPLLLSGPTEMSARLIH